VQGCKKKFGPSRDWVRAPRRGTDSPKKEGNKIRERDAIAAKKNDIRSGKQKKTRETHITVKGKSYGRQGKHNTPGAPDRLSYQPGGRGTQADDGPKKKKKALGRLKKKRLLRKRPEKKSRDVSLLRGEKAMPDNESTRGCKGVKKTDAKITKQGGGGDRQSSGVTIGFAVRLIKEQRRVFTGGEKGFQVFWTGRGGVSIQQKHDDRNGFRWAGGQRRGKVGGGGRRVSAEDVHRAMT